MAFVPLQPPEAVQPVALVLVQLRVDELPLVTVVGVALRVTVGTVGPAATVTVTDCAAVPPSPVHVSVYVVVAAIPVRVSEPVTALAPAQPPDAVQLAALLDDQFSVVEPPLATVVGIAVSVTDGAAGWVTVTLTDCVADPPAPVQVNANAEFAVRAPVDALPDVALVPLQLPEAVHVVALVDDQVSVAADPVTTDAGATASVTDGACGAVGGCVTLAVTVWPAVPPAPEHVSVYAVGAMSVPVGSAPVRALLPLQPPDATQDEELVDDHVRLADAECWTVSGATASATAGGTGAGAGGVGAGVEESDAPPPPQPMSVAATKGSAARSHASLVGRFTPGCW